MIHIVWWAHSQKPGRGSISEKTVDAVLAVTAAPPQGNQVDDETSSMLLAECKVKARIVCESKKLMTA